MPPTTADAKQHTPNAKKHRQILIAGVAIALVVAFVIIRRNASSSSTAASNVVTAGLDPNAIDPNTGLTYGEEGLTTIGAPTDGSASTTDASTSPDISSQLDPLSQQIDSLAQYATGLAQTVNDQGTSLQTLSAAQTQDEQTLSATDESLGSLTTSVSGLSTQTNADLQELSGAVSALATRTAVAPASSSAPSTSTPIAASTPADVPALQPLQLIDNEEGPAITSPTPAQQQAADAGAQYITSIIPTTPLGVSTSTPAKTTPIAGTTSNLDAVKRSGTLH